MSDDLGLFEQLGEPSTRSSRRRAARQARELARRRRRRRRIVLTAAALVLVLAIGAALYAVMEYRELRQVADYPGPGGPQLVVKVEEGDSTSAIASTLAEADVIASPRAFIRAAESESRIRSVQPGYYRMRVKMSGEGAVSLILNPSSRIGQLEIRGGAQLDDITLPDGSLIPGVLSLLSEASCTELNGRSTCVSAEALRQAMGATDPAALGVPSWTRAEVARAEPSRRLEGLIVPGRYDVRPGSDAAELLRTVVTDSSARLEAAGMPGSAEGTGFSPYQVLVIASLIEREAIEPDFDRVARVIENRLAIPMRLQLDSTINYPLDRQMVRTSEVDRAQPGPYNTYLNYGLPPTPIGSPSTAAITAALRPEPGDWLYFVKCQTNGRSCFSVTREQHEAAVRDAVARGIF